MFDIAGIASFIILCLIKVCDGIDKGSLHESSLRASLVAAFTRTQWIETQFTEFHHA